MRFIELTSTETARLEHLHSTSENQVVRRRSQCLLLSAKGHTIGQLMVIFSVCRITVYHWFDGWQATGEASLRHKAGQGRKRALAPIARSVLEGLVEANPQNLSAVTQVVAANHAVECSKDTLRRHLKKVGVAV